MLMPVKKYKNLTTSNVQVIFLINYPELTTRLNGKACRRLEEGHCEWKSTQ